MRGIDELDHYELLEIPRHASSAQIDRAYRVAQQTFAEGSLALYSVFEGRDAAAIRSRLDEAYRVLADAELRARYDSLLAEERPLPPEEAAPPPRDAEGGASFVEDAMRGDAPGETSRGHGSAREEGSLEAFVEEYDALEDDGRGEYDGVRLRKNRLFRGYELDDIADVTKVSPAHLRNIEDENFGDLPADVYVRGFVTAYAKTIGLDPQVVVPSYMARIEESRSAVGRGRFLARR